LEDPDFKCTVDPFWGSTPREILQVFATEACRNIMRKDIWIRALERRILDLSDTNLIVIPDVRFINEVNAIRTWGGCLVKIVRPGWSHEDRATHRSESELIGYDDWDDTIVNEGTLKDLSDKVNRVLYPRFPSDENRTSN
jgi:hypothetical protein